MDGNIPGPRRTIVRNPRTVEDRFARFLSDRVDSLGISGLEVSRRCNISPMNISRWLTGVSSPRLRDLPDLSKALGFRGYRHMIREFIEL